MLSMGPNIWLSSSKCYANFDEMVKCFYSIPIELSAHHPHGVVVISSETFIVDSSPVLRILCITFS